MLQSSGPIVAYPFEISLGPLTLTGFGIAVALGFAIGQITGTRELSDRGHDASAVGDAVAAAVVGFLVGAKLYFVVLTGDLSQVFTRGGFVFWGGLIGGILGAAIVLHLKKFPFWRMADVGGPGIAAGYAVGRTGCFAVGDDYGRPWDGPLAVQFPQGAPASTVENLRNVFGVDFPPGTDPNMVVAVHPTQLYETAMGLIMFLILWKLRKHDHAEGWLLGVYCVLAGIERFIVEFFRAKDDRFFGPLTTAQLISIGFVVAGIAIMQWRARPGPGKPGIHPASAAAAARAA